MVLFGESDRTAIGDCPRVRGADGGRRCGLGGLRSFFSSVGTRAADSLTGGVGGFGGRGDNTLFVGFGGLVSLGTGAATAGAGGADLRTVGDTLFFFLSCGFAACGGGTVLMVAGCVTEGLHIRRRTVRGVVESEGLSICRGANGCATRSVTAALDGSTDAAASVASSGTMCCLTKGLGVGRCAFCFTSLSLGGDEGVIMGGAAGRGVSEGREGTRIIGTIRMTSSKGMCISICFVSFTLARELVSNKRD